MPKSILLRWLLPVLLALVGTGCGNLAARLMVRAPNRYPAWFASEAPVTLDFSPRLLTNFTRQYVDIGPPSARLCYRVINPADYHLLIAATNWLDHGRREYSFNFQATVPGPANPWTASPRGTVILLHGYGLAQFSLLPWALRLGEAGWRCVLVDLRGHGRSTGLQIYYGVREIHDLDQLLAALDHDRQATGPLCVLGESYGAALALRWAGVQPRVQSVVAIAPYGSLSNAVMNIRHDYASWMPPAFIRAGLTQLPGRIGAPAGELDTTTVLARKPVPALFVAGAADTIAPIPEVTRLRDLAAPGSPLIIVPAATHESLAYYFTDLTAPILTWLSQAGKSDK